MNDQQRAAMQMALEALETLWDIIDDIDTYGDMAKADDKLYRSLVERKQRERFKTGITTDGYTLNDGAITALREALAQPQGEPVIRISGHYWVDANVPLSKIIYSSEPAIEAAIEATKEKAAKVCEDLFQLSDVKNMAAHKCAEAIRSMK